MAILLFVPLTAWVVHALFGRGGLHYRAWVFLIGWGITLHLILAGSLVPLMTGWISTATLAIVIQVIKRRTAYRRTLVGRTLARGFLIRPAGS
ncbi:hypothetical protein BOTU111921_07085 [Bordetella tumbae]|uniref:hypothetical protein n=1 Tax=Bordetella tumbae TaxID=1649139 RepID=UPI0039EE5D21